MNVLNMLGAGVRYTCTLESRVSYFSCVCLHCYNSSANWARKLFKPSKDVGSLLVSI